MKVRRFAGAIALIAVAVAPGLSAAAPAAAPAGRVRLLQSTTMSPRARRCLTRLREELMAGGFEVVIGEFGEGGEALWMVDPPTPQEGSLATITLIGNPDVEPAELWVVDGVAGGHAAVRRLLVPAGASTHDDEVLAIRTLEFLRASALELARSAAPPGPGRAPRVTPSTAASEPETFVTAAPPARSARPPRLSLELGLGVLDSSDALDPAFLPLARLRAHLVSLLEARLTVAGLGTRPQVTKKDQGSATVSNDFGLVELRVSFRHGRAVRPAVGVGAGVLLVQVEGEGTPPVYAGQRGHRWAALFDAGAGLTIALGRRFGLAVEAHGQLATPYPTVQFSRDVAARLDHPALLTSLTLVTAL
ncbi:MAG TPA: hypothetical protein VHO67_18485 [Polyangia bacterium]|nr:hypothetical protein [Polyangia bacterium]